MIRKKNALKNNLFSIISINNGGIENGQPTVWVLYVHNFFASDFFLYSQHVVQTNIYMFFFCSFNLTSSKQEEHETFCISLSKCWVSRELVTWLWEHVCGLILWLGFSVSINIFRGPLQSWLVPETNDERVKCVASASCPLCFHLLILYFRKKVRILVDKYFTSSSYGVVCFVANDFRWLNNCEDPKDIVQVLSLQIVMSEIWWKVMHLFSNTPFSRQGVQISNGSTIPKRLRTTMHKRI